MPRLRFRPAPHAGVLALALALAPCPGRAQSRPDLYQCEGCEAIRERPPAARGWRTTIAGPDEPGDRMALSGRVVRPDGRTPAPGVVVYAYHTDATGVYPHRPDDRGWARRHGRLRGWAVTDSAGRYQFDTIRPGPYPGRTDPAHVHMIVQEPGRREYWIDEVVFSDDPRVTPAYRAAQSARGGPGEVTPTHDAGGAWTARRNIVLERR